MKTYIPIEETRNSLLTDWPLNPGDYSHTVITQHDCG